MYHQAPEAVKEDDKYLVSHGSAWKQPVVSLQAASAGHNRWPPISTYKEERQVDPHRIAGVRPRTFWLLLCLLSVIVVGAAIGGTVGGSKATKDSYNKPAATVTVLLYVILTICYLRSRVTKLM